MLKKVGIVAAAATAAMIALSPLAFADHHDGDRHHDDDVETTNIWIDDESEERNQSNVCDFEQDFDNAGVIGPVPLVTQTQTDSCVNTGDAED